MISNLSRNEISAKDNRMRYHAAGVTGTWMIGRV